MKNKTKLSLVLISLMALGGCNKNISSSSSINTETSYSSSEVISETSSTSEESSTSLTEESSSSSEESLTMSFDVAMLSVGNTYISYLYKGESTLKIITVVPEATLVRSTLLPKSPKGS